MSFKVNLYDPSAQPYAPRIRHNDWERHRKIISQLHANKTPRKVMLKHLEDEYNFTPTLGQLQAKCKEWNLKVYTKETPYIKSPVTTAVSTVSGTIARRVAKLSLPAFHLATESGFIEEWSDDYRVHRSPRAETSGHDRSLPPEYIGGGLLANTVDSHWPVPDDENQCRNMLRAAQFYLSLSAFQQSFSIYRAVYLYQARHYSLCDQRLITTILFCACSAVTEHQRNIMHSVLSEVGSSPEIDSLSPLALACLQAASLSMISSDISCDIETGELVKARATAYFHILNGTDTMDFASANDTQALLYRFEHTLLMQEHEMRRLQNLLVWCESAIDRLHREIDDIFVGRTKCQDEYHRRISQVLSGYLLSQWHRPLDDDDQRLQLMQESTTNHYPFQFHTTTTQTLVALAFVIVDAVRCDPLLTQLNRVNDDSSRMWFLDAAKLFKRGIRMLCRLDERSRCAIFADAFLERFYTSISYRQKAYQWTVQMPAIVDSVGISLAQENTWVHENVLIPSPIPEQLDNDRPMHHVPVIQNGIPSTSTENPILCAPPLASECNSITSFMNTYHRTLKRRLGAPSSSGLSTPGDLMSLASSIDFKFGLVGGSSSADVDSLWQMLTSAEGLVGGPT